MNLLGKLDPTDRLIVPVIPGGRFARKISKELKQPWASDGIIAHFTHDDGDYDPKLLLEGKQGFNDEPRNRLLDKHVYLVASHYTNWSPSLLLERICHTASLCLENGAKVVNLVWSNVRLSGNHLRPGSGNKFTHKDLEKYDGKSLSTMRLARRFYSEGISKIVTLHSHSKNIEEAFGEVYFGDITRGKEVFIDLSAAPIVAHYLYTSGKIKGNGDNGVFISTDDGSRDLGIEIINNLQKLDPTLSNLSWIRFGKKRDPQTGVLKEIFKVETSDNYTGHEGKEKFIFDDIVRSFSSMYGVIDKLGGENYTMYATHAHLTGEAQNLLRSSRIKEIIFSNTMSYNLEDPYYEHQLFPKTTVLKIGNYLANAIPNIVEDGNDHNDFYSAKSPSDIIRLGKLYTLRRGLNE
ncbi:MAG: ribose-phosphate pyrophosphokinase [Candidatus Delongbacteria bacterium]|nr:ribose-phosphate pyrophosphokinase [Candidatus Delongbacteria bacterium]MBN2833916.1 ribose-phosphate pyrophosphokinase [Candidatus Delongbacteria bacterium]